MLEKIKQSLSKKAVYVDVYVDVNENVDEDVDVDVDDDDDDVLKFVVVVKKMMINAGKILASKINEN
ncbi:MAG: hypothetical protein J6J59_08190 [Peptococcaceae bacterium]|nr:hypothetical protein [Peptococcaceae bacterium]